MLKIGKKPLIIALTAVLALSTAVTAFVISKPADIHDSQAMYTQGNEEDFTAELQDFDIDFEMTYTDAGGNPVIVKASDFAGSHGVKRLTKAEYATLQLKVDYKGKGKCYYRFKITESWMHTDVNTGKDMITPKALSSYTFGENMYDNRSYDGYIYCTEALKDADKTMTVITKCEEGGDAADLNDKVNDVSQFVDIAFEIDAVQWNRAEVLWGLDKLPWE